MQNMMFKYYLLYSNNLKPQAKSGLEMIATAEPPQETWAKQMS